METALSQQAEVELEIAAFMGPHIKRARIFLVAIGVLYAVTGYLAYGDIASLRESMKGSDGEIAHYVNMLYVGVVFLLCAGIANIALAALAGKKAMIAMYAAVGIFGVHSVLQVYLSQGLLVTSWLWWLTLIILGLGFQA